jgi:WD40 repeat protein/serine/threonine protein kinase
VGHRTCLAASADATDRIVVTDERWERVKDLLHQALQLTDDQRSRFLSEVCRSDDPLRREVESLLAADAEARSSFLAGTPLRGLNLPNGIDSVPSLMGGQIFEQRFRLVRSLGEGGMGQVWLAEQFLPVRREVALKLIRAGMYDESVVQRFRAERQSLAIMDHPCIAKVFEAGATAQGQPYLVMEYVNGSPITEYCDRERLTIFERLQLFIRACEGVQHAHQKAILHRDLKPANILVVDVDGTPTPRIIDFGLAKPLERASAEQALYTQYGQFLGTPGYMSPEQADPAAAQDIDTRADVYSLGVMLYVLLTGLRPFEKSRASPLPLDEWLRQLRTADPPRLTGVLNRETSEVAAAVRSTFPGPLLRLLRGDLEWIASKAVARERDSRYASPAQLADDLRRYLRHEPVSARPASTTYQLRRFIRRHRAVAAVAALVGASAVVATIAGIVAVRRQHDAEYQQRQAQYQTQQALQAQGRLLTEVAAERLRDGDVAGAQRIILDVLTNPGLPQGRTPQATSIFQQSRAADAQLAVLSGHAARVNSARYSPDGTHIVTASADRSVRIWDASTGVLLVSMAGHTDRVFDAVYSPDGTLIASGSNDHTARLWDARTGTLLRTLSGHTARVNSVRFSPDGRRLVTASWDHSARIWDVASGAQVSMLTGHTLEVYSASYSSDGSRIVTASQDKTARIWNARSGSQLRVLEGHGDYVACAAYSSDGRRIVTASADKTARIWDADSGVTLSVLSGHAELVYAAAFSPDGQQVVTASFDKTLRIWDAYSGKQLGTLSGHRAAVASAAYSPDGTRIVSSSEDRTARIWEARMLAPQLVLSGHGDRVNSAAYSPDGGRIVTSSDDMKARVWDAHTGALLLTLSGHTGAVDSAVFSHDGRHILTASQDRTARLWDSGSGAQIGMLSAHIDRVYTAAFAPDDTRVVTASRDTSARARIWDVHSGASLAVLSGHTDRVYSAAWSHDGQRIVTASRDQTARVWDARQGSLLRTLPHEDQVVSAAYSPDDRRIVTASSDGAARVWDALSGAQLSVLSGHGDALTAAQYSPDGKHIVTASEDRTARVWDAQSGEQLAVIPGHDAAVTSAAYSADGSRIVTASADQTARVWDASAPPALETQIRWSAAAQIDPLSQSERAQLGLPRDPAVSTWTKGISTACDQKAAAPYDPDRVAAGAVLEDLNIDAANAACNAELGNRGHVPRVDYQMGRILIAERKFEDAQRELEIAVAAGYRVAQVDLADVLLMTRSAASDSSAARADRARSLYEKAWRDGVIIAAFALGQLYDQDHHATEASAWYQRGADAGEPNSLAHLAEQQEHSAIRVTDATRRHQELLHAFSLYAAAAEHARLQAWPEEALQHWRYRRASLARVLAGDGMMQQVADAYLRSATQP